MEELNLKIEYVPIDSIKPYTGNAKLHPPEQIEQIKESIRRVGFRDPIGVWHGEIVEGHGRHQAAQELGMTEVPIIRLDDLTDEERRAYALIHNQTTMNSGWDFSLLERELESFEMDMSAFGFELPSGGEEQPEREYSTDSDFNYKEQYGVIVMCASEVEQEKVYNRLVGEGFDCKVVAV